MSAQRQVIKRARLNNSCAEPRFLLEFDIPECFRTVENQQFLIADEIFNEERIIIFGTIDHIRLMANSEMWLMDGTFSVVPNIMRQLFTIHAVVGHENNKRTLPLVYCLMSKKTAEIYDRLFCILCEFATANNIILNPRFILSDFEKAAVYASSVYFPNTKNKACFFHFSQIIWRRIQSEGLAIKYGNDTKFNFEMRQLLALAFIPTAKIPEYFSALKSTLCEDGIRIATWFEYGYVLGRPKLKSNSTIIERGQPSYKPQFWAVEDQIEFNLPRTQNSLEAWHNRLQSLVGRHHTGMFDLIKHLQQEEITVQTTIQNLIAGEGPSIRKEYVEKEKRIRQILSEIDRRNPLDTLKGLAYNLSM